MYQAIYKSKNSTHNRKVIQKKNISDTVYYGTAGQRSDYRNANPARRLDSTKHQTVDTLNYAIGLALDCNKINSLLGKQVTSQNFDDLQKLPLGRKRDAVNAVLGFWFILGLL